MNIEDHFPSSVKPRVKLLIEEIMRLQESIRKKQKKLHKLKYATFILLCLCVIPGLIPLIISRVTYSRGLKESRQLSSYQNEFKNLIKEHNLSEVMLNLYGIKV